MNDQQVIVKPQSEPSSSDVEALLSECKEPVVLLEQDLRSVVCTPPGWGLSSIDHAKHQSNPARKAGTLDLHDAQSFASFVNREKNVGSAVWCDANFMKGNVKFVGVINEHANRAGWRDYMASFTPQKSKEWSTWLNFNKRAMSQVWAKTRS